MQKVDKIVKKIQSNQNLKSIHQVFELYPELGELYYKEQQGLEVDLNEEKFKKKKLLLD